MTAKKRSKASSASHADVPAGLGAAGPLWQRFLARAGKDVPDVEIVWKTYTGKTSRQCVVRMKGRNLVYLKPSEGGFLASMALSDAAVATLADAKIPKSLIEEIESSPKYPEGRPARVHVHSTSTLRTAIALLAIKQSDVLRMKG